MEMGPLPVYPDSSVAHDGDRLPAFDRITRMHPDGAQVSVQAVVTGAVPVVLDHDVFPVVRVAGHEIGVYYFPVGNSAHFIQRFTTSITVQRPNVDPFMKTGINNAPCRVRWITHKTVLTAFPWRGFHAVVVSFDVLVEGSPSA